MYVTLTSFIIHILNQTCMWPSAVPHSMHHNSKQLMALYFPSTLHRGKWRVDGRNISQKCVKCHHTTQGKALKEKQKSKPGVSVWICAEGHPRKYLHLLASSAFFLTGKLRFATTSWPDRLHSSTGCECAVACLGIYMQCGTLVEPPEF